MKIYRFAASPLPILLIAALFTIGWPAEVMAQNAVTFVIDGLDPSQNAKEIITEPLLYLTTERGYLKNSPLVSQLPPDSAGRIVDIPWSGDVRDGVDADNAVTLLQAAIRNVPEGTRINIVTHSFGSVIAYKALENIGKTGPPIENFVTLSSPLGRDQAANTYPGLAIPIPSIKEIRESFSTNLNIKPGRWINRYALGDTLSGKIMVDGVNNKLVVTPDLTKMVATVKMLIMSGMPISVVLAAKVALVAKAHSLTYSNPGVAQEISTGFSTGNYQGKLYDQRFNFADATAGFFKKGKATVRHISLFLNGGVSGAAGELLRRLETSRTNSMLDQAFAQQRAPIVPFGRKQEVGKVSSFAKVTITSIKGCTFSICNVFEDGKWIYGIRRDDVGVALRNIAFGNRFAKIVSNSVVIVDQIKSAGSSGGSGGLLIFVLPVFEEF